MMVKLKIIPSSCLTKENLWSYKLAQKLQLTLGLCAGVALEFLPPEQMPRFVLKIND